MYLGVSIAIGTIIVLSALCITLVIIVYRLMNENTMLESDSKHKTDCLERQNRYIDELYKKLERRNEEVAELKGELKKAEYEAAEF